MANPTIRYQLLEETDEGAVAALTMSRASEALLQDPEALEGAYCSEEETKDVLQRLHKMSQFESMSYDPVENDVERSVNVHRRHWDYLNEEGWRWFISAMIGFTMGIIAFFVDWGIEVLNTWKISNTLDVMDADQPEMTPLWMPYCTFVGFSLMYALVAGAMVSYVEPLAAGSGIPEIKVYLNGVHIKGLLHIKALAAKLFGVMFSIGSGMVAGKEGPFVHGGGIVGGGLGSMGSKFFTELTKGKLQVKTSRKVGGYFRNHADHRDFVAIGTAAGVSTAFAAPIGGLLFTIEEGASFYSLATVLWRGFLATCTGLITLHFLVEMRADESMWKAKLGIIRDFGLYDDGDAQYGHNLFYYLWEMPVYILIGAVGGLLGALFIKLNVQITRIRMRFVPVRLPHRRLLEVLFVAFVTSTAAFMLSYASPCSKLPSDFSALDLDTSSERFFGGGGARGHPYFPQLWCKNGEYSRWGQVLCAPLTQALRLVFHLGETLPDDNTKFQFEPDTLAVLALFTFAFMTWTFGVGAPTGLFVPSLTVGATTGRLIGMGLRSLMARWGMSIRVSIGSYAIVGAAASLGGATRMTISIVILVMETTGALQLLVPIMVAAWVAKMVGDSFGLGIYDTQIEMRGQPLLAEDTMEPESRMVHDELSVNELMSTEMVCLPAVIKVRELATALRTFSHGGYPVSSEAEVPVAAATSPMRIDGLIARPLLLRLLQRRLGFIKKGQEGGSFPLPRTEKGVLDVLDTIEPYPMRINPRSEQEAILAALSEVDLETDIDLRPFMQRQPFLVNEDASLSRAYRLFRTLGLRHLLVAPSRPLGLGILTRKDMIKENVRLALGEKANREAAKVTASRRGERRIKEKFDAGGARTLVEFMPAFDTAAEQGTAMASAVPRQLIRRSVVPRATRQESEAREAMEQGAAESAAGSS